MKVSISWIFDHINADWHAQDIEYLISKFNKVSAEIESFKKIKFDLTDFAIGRISEIKEDQVKVIIPEWKKEIFLSQRSDQFVDQYFMIKKDNNDIKWATLKNFNLDKDGFIPALDITQENLDGNWKKDFESDDIILEVDNKSITHRPDMWGHRGFAREIAAFMDLPFKSADKFLVHKDVASFDKVAKPMDDNPIGIEIKATKECKRFAGLFFDSIENKTSDIFIVSRLLKVGVRPINSIVDITNYLTLDWSQPVHAYDASKIDGNMITIRMAKQGEKINLLDDSILELTNQDLVIADKKKPLCLAGIMGGIDSGVNSDTKSLFFESANFDSTSIRLSSLKYGVRTESSMRFEKTLDPNQNIDGILRFIFLLKKYNIKFSCANEILSVGPLTKAITLEVEHEFLEKKSGVTFSEYDVTVPLTRLGFKVEKDLIQEDSLKHLSYSENKNYYSTFDKGEGTDFERFSRKLIYSITVPTFRSSKDVQIPEAILEEVVRFYGFDRITPQLPKFEKLPEDLTPVLRRRKIKSFLVNCTKMIEQQNYIFFDEQFLKSIDFEPNNVAAQVINPISVDQKRLITSLLPGLFKNIKDNFVHQDSLRFFEFNRIWLSDNKKQIVEQKSLAGIFFEKRSKLDFYSCKSYLNNLLSLIGIDFKNTDWKKIDKPQDLWCAKYQTAEIIFDNKKIGIAGKVDSIFLNKLDVLPESDAFFFEFDGDFLLNFIPQAIKFVPLSKYQETFFDLSLLIPLKLTTMELERKLKNSDELITKVDLIDFFENEKWMDKRSLAFRVWISDYKKTLEKAEIESVREKTICAVQSLGAKLRNN